MKTLTLILVLASISLAQDTSKVYLFSRQPDGTMKLVSVPKVWLSGESFQPQATATVDTSVIATQSDLRDSIAYLRVAKQAILARNTGLAVYTLLANGTTAMDFANNSCVKVTPTASATFTTTVPPAGLESYLMILTTGTTSRTITFGTGFKSTGTLATGTTSGKVFVIHFISDGTTVYESGRTTAQ